MSAPGILSFDAELALGGFSLRCAFQVEREVVVLFGASGAGKDEHPGEHCRLSASGARQDRDWRAGVV